ncbi:MAG TPA: hypothetical protein VMB91_02755 [Solirubrobacteraceae bacterium]|nr:hypothetical protein [Solirubrobacteraceae bacterium]
MTGTIGGRLRPAVTHALYLAALAVIAALLVAANAHAAPATLCVKATKTTEKPKHYTGGWSDKNCTAPEGKHEGKYEKLANLTTEQEQKLTALLAHVNVQEEGIDQKPTVQFTGANVQIVNGEGKTQSTNGEGNLVLGYDEDPGAQTGSHDLILGEEQTYTSYAGILAGQENTNSGPFDSVLGGWKNSASGENNAVLGGSHNTASASINGAASTVAGGSGNVASGPVASIIGGNENTADGSWAFVGGGEKNLAGGPGFSEYLTSVFGGYNNKSLGNHSSVAGGNGKEALNSMEAVL